MPLRSASLGLKLNLYLLLLFVVPGAATSAILVYGFNRTQDNATERSQEALEELGRLTLSAVAGGAAGQGGLQFEMASEIGQQAARYMESFGQVGAAAPVVDSSGLARTEAGLYYDPDPSRTSDLLISSYVELDDTPVQDELAYSAALDAIFDTRFGRSADAIGGGNFGPGAIAFLGTNGVNRYYPPIGLHELAPGDLDVFPVSERVGPTGNPDRRTIWRAPYEDEAGRGLLGHCREPRLRGRCVPWGHAGRSPDRPAGRRDQRHPAHAGRLPLLRRRRRRRRSPANRGGVSARLAGEELVREFAAVLDGMRAGGVEDGITVSGVETGVVVEKVLLEGEGFFIAYTPLPSLGGSFAVAAPVSEITADAAAIIAGVDEEGTRTFRAMLAAMEALFLLGVVGAGYLNRRVLLHPSGSWCGARARSARATSIRRFPSARVTSWVPSPGRST